MNELKLRPDVKVFNRLLQSLRSQDRREKEFLSVYREMIALGIRPSLTSYHHLLQQVQPTESLFNDILSSIEQKLGDGEALEAVDDQDDDFFVGSMILVNRKLRNKAIADRILNIFKVG